VSLLRRALDVGRGAVQQTTGADGVGIQMSATV